jgi:ergothioneine biosynthesis protein EgtB
MENSTMKTAVADRTQVELMVRYTHTRQTTLELCKGLTAEDMMVQSLPEASPAKWHLAHTAWFFESFVLREYLPGYRPFHTDFHWLFNSYYESFSIFPEKRLRSSFSRPGLDEVLDYRKHVDEGIAQLLAADAAEEALRRIELGVNHEEQHQELLLTDIMHAFFTNPLHPVYRERADDASDASPVPMLAFERHQGGMHECGHNGRGFCFDNELPRHKIWLEPFSFAQRLITCGEFAQFMADGGYRRPELWLSAGWSAVKNNGWSAPLYWTNESDHWTVFTLRGKLPIEKVAACPVSHVSFYEAEAYARWAGKRLPTEFEWESVVQGQPVEGNLLDSGELMPMPGNHPAPNHADPKGFGDCWQWTASAYLGYPGFAPLKGTLGEYNGKFMSGQMVLRGGSCVTPQAHIRASYRNFFVPETRWQFSGIRLADW